MVVRAVKARIALVRIFPLAILAFALCSCAEFKGFHLKYGGCGDNIRGHDCGAEGDGE